MSRIVELDYAPWNGIALTTEPDGTRAWAWWPCPMRNRAGGIGGQMLTSCGLCGGLMANTAGTSHTGRQWCPVIAVGGAWELDLTPLPDEDGAS